MRLDLTTATWRTSSHSNGAGTQCVEVAALGAGVAARDSKDRAGGVLGFTGAEWASFVDDVKGGVYDLA
ncbi:DUF397 domain-containing protein [Actinomadura fibrosa]|uniref:DUF397 domain-containing protein n=1 Tax=Actinomadura fibrosa TaxID=111802 RepID=A0ABW2XYC1_9ACTN|nr:DUF397 domain-containing protein [Actinomadura fibrosa]